MKHSAVSLSLLLLLTVPTSLSAKGDMVLVEIRGATLVAPLKITDPKIMDFSPWAGPGVNGATLDKTAPGFIADWNKGAVATPPVELTRFEVFFYVGCRTIPTPSCLNEPPVLCYMVSYAYRPGSPHGFIHFPGTGEAMHDLDTGTIYHGPRVEGHWFVATDEWEGFIRPLIAKSKASRPNRN
jgi:hypothetical protein